MKEMKMKNRVKKIGKKNYPYFYFKETVANNVWNRENIIPLHISESNLKKIIIVTFYIYKNIETYKGTLKVVFSCKILPRQTFKVYREKTAYVLIYLLRRSQSTITTVIWADQKIYIQTTKTTTTRQKHKNLLVDACF